MNDLVEAWRDIQRLEGALPDDDAGRGPRWDTRRVSGTVSSSWRPTVREHGWERPVAVPISLGELTGGLDGVVELPLRLSWSGAPEGRGFDLATEHDRRMLYEKVLTEGTINDVQNYLNAAELARLWNGLWLSPHVHRAWAPLIAAASA